MTHHSVGDDVTCRFGQNVFRKGKIIMINYWISMKEVSYFYANCAHMSEKMSLNISHISMNETTQEETATITSNL